LYKNISVCVFIFIYINEYVYINTYIREAYFGEAEYACGSYSEEMEGAYDQENRGII
jgi:hypothetical protein